MIRKRDFHKEHLKNNFFYLVIQIYTSSILDFLVTKDKKRDWPPIVHMIYRKTIKEQKI